MWRPDNWEEIVGKADGSRFHLGVEAGADAILKEALVALEKEIRAHTSLVSAEAIIESKLWKQILSNS